MMLTHQPHQNRGTYVTQRIQKLVHVLYPFPMTLQCILCNFLFHLQSVSHTFRGNIPSVVEFPQTVSLLRFSGLRTEFPRLLFLGRGSLSWVLGACLFWVSLFS